ncbi:hypothetical protein BaRGS_00025351 [Batillaria attramentaria]|uniref:Uncharacterized protein n=1 Tax=Batillaria attramentaria TaxID=370345 RepID=A0ABD0K8W7_9CAEN
MDASLGERPRKYATARQRQHLQLHSNITHVTSAHQVNMKLKFGSQLQVNATWSGIKKMPGTDLADLLEGQDGDPEDVMWEMNDFYLQMQACSCSSTPEEADHLWFSINCCVLPEKCALLRPSQLWPADL